MIKIANKLEKLKLKKQNNDEKIFEFQEKIKTLQKENNKLEKEIQKELDKQILFEIKEKNISIEDLKNLLENKDTLHKHNNYHNNKNYYNNISNNNIDNQERS